MISYSFKSTLPQILLKRNSVDICSSDSKYCCASDHCDSIVSTHFSSKNKIGVNLREHENLNSEEMLGILDIPQLNIVVAAVATCKICNENLSL